MNRPVEEVGSPGAHSKLNTILGAIGTVKGRRHRPRHSSQCFRYCNAKTSANL